MDQVMINGEAVNLEGALRFSLTSNEPNNVTIVKKAEPDSQLRRIAKGKKAEGNTFEARTGNGIVLFSNQVSDIHFQIAHHPEHGLEERLTVISKTPFI